MSNQLGINQLLLYVTLVKISQGDPWDNTWVLLCIIPGITSSIRMYFVELSSKKNHNLLSLCDFEQQVKGKILQTCIGLIINPCTKYDGPNTTHSRVFS